MLIVNNVGLSAMLGGTHTSPVVVTIYQGAMPVITPSSVYSASTYASQALVTFPSVAATVVAGKTLSLNPITPTNATATGTATWFSAFSSSNSGVWIGTITDVGPGISPMYVDNVNIVAGTPVNVIQVGFTLS